MGCNDENSDGVMWRCAASVKKHLSLLHHCCTDVSCRCDIHMTSWTWLSHVLLLVQTLARLSHYSKPLKLVQNIWYTSRPHFTDRRNMLFIEVWHCFGTVDGCSLLHRQWNLGFLLHMQVNSMSFQHNHCVAIQVPSVIWWRHFHFIVRVVLKACFLDYMYLT